MTKMPMSSLLQFTLYAHQQRNILLNGEPPNVAEDNFSIVIAPAALLRMEQRGIDAARHQVARTGGRVPQEAAEIWIRREKQIGVGVKARCDCQGKVFDGLARSF